MNHIFVFAHFEMGDSIICNGLVRNLAKTNDITLFSKFINQESMTWMYRDLENLDFVFFDSYHEAENFIIKNDPNPLIRFGFEYITNPKNLESNNIQFDEMYYRLAGLPFEKRWSDFFVERDIEREKSILTKYGVVERDYVFVHDEYSNESPNFKYDLIEHKHLRVIKPNKCFTRNIFDYCYLIENAKEIHCTCSSFKNLVDSLKIENIPLYFHMNRSTFEKHPCWISSCNLNWTKVPYFCK